MQCIRSLHEVIFWLAYARCYACPRVDHIVSGGRSFRLVLLCHERLLKQEKNPRILEIYICKTLKLSLQLTCSKPRQRLHRLLRHRKQVLSLHNENAAHAVQERNLLSCQDHSLFHKQNLPELYLQMQQCLPSKPHIRQHKLVA